MAQDGFRRKQPGLLVENRPHELVGTAKPFHKDVAHTLIHHGHCLGNCRKLRRIMDDREFSVIDSFLVADILDDVFVSDQCGIYHAEIDGLARRRNGMSVYGPCRYHSFLGTSACKFGKDVVKFGKHDSTGFYSSIFCTMCIVS